MIDLKSLTISKASEALAAKEFTSLELTEEYIGAIEASDLNAYITTTFDMAREQAGAADKAIAKGEQKPLTGIPLGIKDIFCTKGVRTTCASRMLENFVPQYESTVTRKFLDQNAVFLGKTNLDEFAMGSDSFTSYFGPPRNPYSPPGEFLTPGGSSGGSSAAVAGNLCLGATGTDTGGSIREPASFTGIVGLKPTYGLVSRHGVIALGSSLDCPGPMAKTVEDAAILLQAMAGHDPMDAMTNPRPVPKYELGKSIKGLRIGIPAEYREGGLHPDMARLWDDYAELLKKEGAQIFDISLPHTKYALPIYYIIQPCDASSNLARYDGVKYGFRTGKPFKSLDEMYELTRTEGFGFEVKRRLINGTTMLTEEFYEKAYVKAMKVRRVMMDEFKNTMNNVDVLLCPTVTGPAYAKGAKMDPVEVYMNDVYTVTANMVGTPAVSIPVGATSDGLPLGLQLVGRWFDEQTILNLGNKMEEMAK